MYKTKWVAATYLPQESSKFSQISINGVKMAEAVERVCNTMEEKGYNLVNIKAAVDGVAMGRYAILKNKSVVNQTEQCCGGWGYGHGFSYTSGIILLFRK